MGQNKIKNIMRSLALATISFFTGILSFILSAFFLSIIFPNISAEKAGLTSLSIFCIAVIITPIAYMIHNNKKNNVSLSDVFKINTTFQYKKYIRYIFLIVIFITILSFFIYYSLHFLFGGDLKTINEQGLLLDVVNIPDEENAYFDILELNKLELYKTIDDSSKLLEAEKLDLVQIKELFVNNKEALEILNNFSKKKFYQSPDLANPKVTSFDSRVISYTKLRESVRILALKAKYELEIRNEGQSYKDTKIILDIGQKMTSSQCVLIEYLVGLSINKKGLESITRITKQTNNHSLLNTIDKELENYKPQVNKSVFKDDYIKAKNTISKSDFLDTLASWNPGNKYWNFLSEILYDNNFYYKQNETLNIIAENTRQKINNYQKKCSEKNIKEDVIYGDFNTFFMLTNRNSFGQSLSDFSKMQLSSVKDKRCENENIFLEIKSTLSEKLK